jgi:hypothetical protein
MEHILFGLSIMAVPDDFGRPETFHPEENSTTFDIWQTWRPRGRTTDNEGMARHGRRLLTNAIDVRGPPNPLPTTPAGWSRALEEAESREGLENSLKRSLAVFKARDAETDKKKADSKEDSDLKAVSKDDSDDAHRNKITPEDENTKKDKNYTENGNVNFWMTCPLEVLLTVHLKVMTFASLNPKDHFNQVAITNRRNNIVWRRLVMNFGNLRHFNQRMMLERYIYDVIPRINDQIAEFDVPVNQLHDLLALM